MAFSRPYSPIECHSECRYNVPLNQHDDETTAQALGECLEWLARQLKHQGEGGP
jgi:hypothetical protein